MMQTNRVRKQLLFEALGGYSGLVPSSLLAQGAQPTPPSYPLFTFKLLYIN